MVFRTRRWLRVTAVGAAVALVGLVGTAAASAAPPEGVSMKGTGPQPSGLGLFSTAALAQENCADNGRMTSTYAGGGPWCVNPWKQGQKNGGATAPGVTATTVKVIIYVPNEQMAVTDTGLKNQATGARATVAEVYADTQKAYEALEDQYQPWQLWGREPKFEIVAASGADEAAQRADAVVVIAKKPFMVVDMSGTTSGGAPVFSAALAAKKIVTVSPSTDATNSAAQAPYRWNYGADPSAGPAIVSALVGKSLSGKKAEWAGDADLKSKTRAFGLIYPTTGFDLPSFEKYLKQSGGTLADKVSYDPAAAKAGTASFPTLVSHLKSTGVTSVILFAAPADVKSIMAAATEQGYHPEWIFTGQGYQEYDGLARANDPEQMAHAFGVGTLGPNIVGRDAVQSVFQWYWGTGQGNINGTAGAAFGSAYQMMHYAGPTLTADNVQKGMFSAPSYQSASYYIGLNGYGKTVGTPYDEYASFGSDRAVLWWDGEVVGTSNGAPQVGKGLFQYLNDGVSVGYSGFTKTTPKFFDKSVSVTERNAADFYPGNVLPTPVPCHSCPSNSTAAAA